MEDNAASSSQKKVDSFSEVLRNLVDWLITQVHIHHHANPSTSLASLLLCTSLFWQIVVLFDYFCDSFFFWMINKGLDVADHVCCEHDY